MKTRTAFYTFHRSSVAAAVGLMLAGIVYSTQTSAVVLGDQVQANHYNGVDRNWFNPANWSRGQVPGAGDTVVLDEHDDVVIDPAQDTARGEGRYGYAFEDLIISDYASLETLPDTLLEVGTTVIDATASLTLRSSAMLGGTLVVGANSPEVRQCLPSKIVECELRPWGGFGSGGLKLNPTPKSKRDVILKTSATVDVGLGGIAPASIGQDADGALQIAAGKGHYATLSADTLVIDGELKLSLYYGFQPRPGDSFQIITAQRSASGEFLGIPEGGFVACTDDSIAFRLSYRGGDGNDVVVTAEQANPLKCRLLPAIQRMWMNGCSMHWSAILSCRKNSGKSDV